MESVAALHHDYLFSNNVIPTQWTIRSIQRQKPEDGKSELLRRKIRQTPTLRQIVAMFAVSTPALPPGSAGLSSRDMGYDYLVFNRISITLAFSLKRQLVLQHCNRFRNPFLSNFRHCQLPLPGLRRRSRFDVSRTNSGPTTASYSPFHSVSPLPPSSRFQG